MMDSRSIFFQSMERKFHHTYGTSLTEWVSYPDLQDMEDVLQLRIKEILTVSIQNWMIEHSIKTDTSYYIDRGVVYWNLKKPAR